MKRVLTVLAVLWCWQGVQARGDGPAVSLSNRERAIAFAVQREIMAAGFGNRRDMCFGLGSDQKVNEKAIRRELYRIGTKLHADNWCNRGPRGISISILSPVIQMDSATYEFQVDLGDADPIRLNGAHFATLLRRGRYTVRCVDGSEPELVTYDQVCCSKILTAPAN